jgi:hypothetical protein
MQLTRAAALAPAAIAFVLFVLSSASGCYKPSILDGGFLCSKSGACPDGFKCGADKHCSVMPLAAVPDAGPGTDGPKEAPPDCTSPPVTALCSAAPAAGQACNPTCQTGCACGRCNVVGKTATCVPNGTVLLGELCTYGSDNCAAGLICLREQDGCGNPVIARCYRHCTVDAQCGTDTFCQISIQDSAKNDTGFSACDVPPRDCDPVANTGCPSPALNCYYTSLNETVCDCATGTGKNGDKCAVYSDCAPGFVCISLAGAAGARCQFECKVGVAANCPSGTTCMTTTTGAKYGYCGS